MATWLFIGTILGVVLLLGFLCGRRGKVLSFDGQHPHHNEEQRRADEAAKDAAREADAKTNVYQGNYPV